MTGVRAAVAVTAALFAACTRVERTTVVVPNAPDAIDGAYAVRWPDALHGGCTIGTDGSIRLAPYPCPVTVEIGGVIELYDPLTGAALIELKTIDGSVKLSITGTFAPGPPRNMIGVFEARVLDMPCDSGQIVMVESP